MANVLGAVLSRAAFAQPRAYWLAYPARSEASFRRSHPSSRTGPVQNGTAPARFPGSGRARDAAARVQLKTAPKRVPARGHHSAAPGTEQSDCESVKDA